MEPAAVQRLRHRAALVACNSGDENRSIASHSVHLFCTFLASSRRSFLEGPKGAGIVLLGNLSNCRNVGQFWLPRISSRSSMRLEIKLPCLNQTHTSPSDSTIHLHAQN